VNEPLSQPARNAPVDHTFEERRKTLEILSSPGKRPLLLPEGEGGFGPSQKGKKEKRPQLDLESSRNYLVASRGTLDEDLGPDDRGRGDLCGLGFLLLKKGEPHVEEQGSGKRKAGVIGRGGQL